MLGGLVDFIPHMHQEVRGDSRQVLREAADSAGVRRLLQTCAMHANVQMVMD